MSTIIDTNNVTNDQFCVKVEFVGIQKWLILGVKGERQLLN